MKRYQRAAAKWLKHLKAWQQSGSTQAAYCKKNKLCPQTFTCWKRRFRDRHPELISLPGLPTVPPSPAAPLVAVNLIDDLADKPQHGKPSGISLSVGGKYQVSMATDFDSPSLRRLLSVLAEI